MYQRQKEAYEMIVKSLDNFFNSYKIAKLQGRIKEEKKVLKAFYKLIEEASEKKLKIKTKIIGVSTCAMCKEITETKKLVSGCGHYTCLKCMKTMLSEASDAKFDSSAFYAKCKICNQPLETKDIFTILPSGVLNKWNEQATSVKPVFTCPLCLDEELVEKAITLDCNHRFHSECIAGHLQILIKESRVDADSLACPIPDCKQPIPHEAVPYLIDEQHLDKLTKFRLKGNDNLIGDELAKFCPNCDTPTFIAKDLLDFTCPKCKHHICPQCHENVHEGKTCAELAQEKKNKVEDEEFKKFAKDQNWKDCPICHMFVEKFTGCNFIYCGSLDCKKKGNKFCYLCGVKLEEKHHFAHFKKTGPFGQTCNTMDGIPGEP